MRANNCANINDIGIYNDILVQLILDQCGQDFLDKGSALHKRLKNNGIRTRAAVYSIQFSCSTDEPVESSTTVKDSMTLTLSSFHLAWYRQVLELGLKRLGRSGTDLLPYYGKVLQRNLNWLNQQMGNGQDVPPQRGWDWCSFITSKITSLEKIYDTADSND